MPSHSSTFTAKEVLVYKLIIIFLSISIIFIGHQYWRSKQVQTLTDDPLAEKTDLPSSTPPYYEEIMDIIRPLRYSGIPAIIKENINLSIDFEKGIWTLHNIHSYNEAGEILLEDNRYGLCGELANYTYNKIYPIIKDQYNIKFVQVAESGFFLYPKASHIILVIYNDKTGESFMIDPSFQRYGPPEDFEDYLFFEYSDSIIGVAEKERDVSFPVETGIPLLIHNDFLSSFSVGSTDQKFDRNNFTLAIKANRKHHYAGRYIFGIRKKNGVTQIFEDNWIRNDVLPPQDIELLKKKITAWFYSITEE